MFVDVLSGFAGGAERKRWKITKGNSKKEGESVNDMDVDRLQTEKHALLWQLKQKNNFPSYKSLFALFTLHTFVYFVTLIWFIFVLQAENNLDKAYVPAVLDDVKRLMDPLYELLKSVKRFTSLLTPVLDLMDDLQTFVGAGKEYMNKSFETTAAEINHNEENLRRVMATLTQLEKNKDEL